MGNEIRIGLKNIGKVNPESIDDYIKLGGYEAYRKALEMLPDDIIAEIEKSGLRGRGGAGFPTGIKWKYTKASDKHPKYVVCNADEGEPGTFKDRSMMELDPHTYIEGLMISAVAIRALKGYIYIRGEYTKSIERTYIALNQAREKGLLGKDILGTDFSFDIEVKLGAGSYLCGEEFTLIESLEGKRGNPRYKPPFPAEKGVFSQPTIVNNVETLTHVPAIIKNGADWYKQYGTEKSPGTKIFTISGDVKKPGYYEVEMGIPLGDIIYDFGGGIKNDKKLKSVIIGGAAGTFFPEKYLDTKMDFDYPKERGGVMGSGAVIVLDEDKSIYEMLVNVLEFFKHESCGKCVPCRVGSSHLVMMIEKLKDATDRRSKEVILNKMLDLATSMEKDSLCALGQSHILPLRSAISFHIDELL